MVTKTGEHPGKLSLKMMLHPLVGLQLLVFMSWRKVDSVEL